MTGVRSQIKREAATRRLTTHQQSVLRDFAQLGTIETVAVIRGVQVATVNQTLRRCREKLGVRSSREAAEKAEEGAHG